jgi:hypothetical protein
MEVVVAETSPIPVGTTRARGAATTKEGVTTTTTAGAVEEDTKTDRTVATKAVAERDHTTKAPIIRMTTTLALSAVVAEAVTAGLTTTEALKSRRLSPGVAEGPTVIRQALEEGEGGTARRKEGEVVSAPHEEVTTRPEEVTTAPEATGVRRTRNLQRASRGFDPRTKGTLTAAKQRLKLKPQ